MDTRRKLLKPRKKRSIVIRLDLYQWVEEQIEKGQFSNFSHATEIALEKLKDAEKKENNRD
jgi:Arc/MetJ-type ribon-helix-helix transcriptional regulator